MKILYCDLCPKSTVEGHKHFDAAWCQLLSNIADVTLLSFENEWYKEIGENIDEYIYDISDELNKRKWLSWKIWEKGNFRRLCVNDHVEANLYIKKALELNKEKHFDYIIIGALDIISYLFYRKKLLKASKLAVIEHSADRYNIGITNKIFLKIKNDFTHIVMEEDAITHFSDKYGINKGIISYIPHMLNSIAADKPVKIEGQTYDVVGISNSNNDNEVAKIINLEKEDNFFANNGLKAIFRSRNLEYESQNLKVFKGRLGFSYEEYYTYIRMAKVVVLPFSTGFGLRSSGTIMDTFSQNVPIIGNPFGTMIQYNRSLPHICKLYTTMDEFKKGIFELISLNGDYQDEYRYFQETHSDDFIIAQMKKTFVQGE